MDSSGQPWNDPNAAEFERDRSCFARLYRSGTLQGLTSAQQAELYNLAVKLLRAIEKLRALEVTPPSALSDAALDALEREAIKAVAEVNASLGYDLTTTDGASMNSRNSAYDEVIGDEIVHTPVGSPDLDDHKAIDGTGFQGPERSPGSMEVS